MKTKDPRFPFKLAIVDAIFLVRHLPSLTAIALRSKWQYDIFHKDSLEVDQVMYGCMRRESTNNVVANQALDKIFGKDVPRPNYEKGDLLFVRQRGHKEWSLRYFDSFNVNGTSVNCYDGQNKQGFVTSWIYHALCTGTLPD